MSEALAPVIALVRLRAEAVVLRRLDGAAGFADPRLPGPLHLRDPEAAARLVRGTLRPQGGHARQLAEVDAAIAATLAAGLPPSRLDELAARFGLDAGERAVVAIAMAYELCPDTRELAHAAAGRRRAGLYADVAADLAPELGTPTALLRALHPAGTLRAAGLVELVREPDNRRAAATAPIALSRRLLDWLTGDDRLAEPLRAVVRVLTEPTGVWLAPAVTAELATVADRLARAPAITLLVGAAGSGRLGAAEALAGALGRPLLVASLPELLELERRTREPLLRAALTEAQLRGAVPYLPGVEALAGDDGKPADRVAAELITGFGGPIILGTGGALPIAPGRPVHVVRLPRPDLDDRVRAWTVALADRSAIAAPAIAELAGRYVLGPGAIAEVVTEAAAVAGARGEPLDRALVEDAVSRRLAVRLGSFGTIITRKARFAEMVLPDEVVDTLRDMIAMIRERAQILERWGYARHLGLSRGVSALFSGEPGTGKTMAASVLASELGLELVRIDLATVVSKYVGETEKNLARIFDEAQHAQAMLLFDEADSLFGKRTEVRSAQDRYANLEVNYILQRMETFDGISVLTTNLEGAIDQALQRRLNFRIRFPEPEVDEREQLWQRLLPPDAAVAGEVPFRALAERFAMTGGYIKNAIVRAAVSAARDGRSIAADDLWTGADAEYAEMGKVMPSMR